MDELTGFFIDWDGNARPVAKPGKGWRCEVDLKTKYVMVFGKHGTLDHESTYYPTLEAIAAKGIKAELVEVE
jgi:hypothetical protein